MGLFDFFKSKEKEEINYLRTVIHLALVAGDMDKTKLALIGRFAKKLNVSTEEMKSVLKTIHIKTNPPTELKMKLSLLEDLISVMLIDLKIELKEYIFILRKAHEFNVPRFAVDETTQIMINNLSENGVDENTIYFLQQNFETSKSISSDFDNVFKEFKGN